MKVTTTGVDNKHAAQSVYIFSKQRFVPVSESEELDVCDNELEEFLTDAFMDSELQL